MTILEISVQFWRELTSRVDGPFSFRFVLQPLVAISLAIRDGMHDGRWNRTPFLWAVLFRPAERASRLREGLHATSRVIALAVLLDLVYQVIVLKGLRPLETVVIAFVLAYLPYVLARGPAARISRVLHKPG